MLDFAIFAVTFVIILVGAVLYLYPVSFWKHLTKTTGSEEWLRIKPDLLFTRFLSSKPLSIYISIAEKVSRMLLLTSLNLYL